jgi:hypothetical protein
LSHIQQAEVGGDARHAEHAQGSRDRRQGRIDLAGLVATAHAILLPAAMHLGDVAGDETRVS